jgi:hypothetical protein
MPEPSMAASLARYFTKDQAHTLAAEIEACSVPLAEELRGGSISRVALVSRVNPFVYL